MTLFFEVMALFTAFLSCCGRLGAALAFVVSAIALFFFTLAVTIITYVKSKSRAFPLFLGVCPRNHLQDHSLTSVTQCYFR